MNAAHQIGVADLADIDGYNAHDRPRQRAHPADGGQGRGDRAVRRRPAPRRRGPDRRDAMMHGHAEEGRRWTTASRARRRQATNRSRCRHGATASALRWSCSASCSRSARSRWRWSGSTPDRRQPMLVARDFGGSGTLERPEEPRRLKLSRERIALEALVTGVPNEGAGVRALRPRGRQHAGSPARHQQDRAATAASTTPGIRPRRDDAVADGGQDRARRAQRQGRGDGSSSSRRCTPSCSSCRRRHDARSRPPRRRCGHRSGGGEIVVLVIGVAIFAGAVVFIDEHDVRPGQGGRRPGDHARTRSTDAKSIDATRAPDAVSTTSTAQGANVRQQMETFVAFGRSDGWRSATQEAAESMTMQRLGADPAVSPADINASINRLKDLQTQYNAERGRVREARLRALRLRRRPGADRQRAA